MRWRVDTLVSWVTHSLAHSLTLTGVRLGLIGGCDMKMWEALHSGELQRTLTRTTIDACFSAKMVEVGGFNCVVEF